MKVERGRLAGARDLRCPLVIWSTMALAVLLAGSIAVGSGPAGVISTWFTFDALHYRDIAEHGYSFGVKVDDSVGWFPGYPLAIRGLRPILGTDGAAVTIAAGAGLSAAALFWVWISDRGQAGAARLLGTLTLLGWPYAFFLFGVPYSDAPFLALAIGAFILAERSKYVAAGLCAAFASATRPTGVVLVIALVVLVLERTGALRVERGARRWAPRMQVSRSRAGMRHAAVLIGLLGIASYFFYCWRTFGDPLVYAKVQNRITPHESLTSPRTWVRANFLLRVDDMARTPSYLAASSLQGVAVVGAAASAPAVVHRYGAGYGVYVLGVVGTIWIRAWDFASAGRYLIAAFPVAALGGRWLAERRVARIVVPTIMVTAMLFLANRFSAGDVYSNW